MLYVFHVDTGRMIKFDMNVALSSVQNLKDMIERLHGFPSANIVLLVSGGEMLTPGSLVCSYSAGTDTNPIYMFCTVDVKPQPWPSIEPDVDLKEQVDRCLSLPATYSTVVTRATLAQQIYDLAREEESICERLVHEQHLQQQGWSAVIANMEDLTDEFRQRYENFNRYFDEHLRKRNEYLELLGQFNKDLEKLSRIPILPGLMQNAEEEFHGFDDYLDNDEVFSRSQQNSSMIQQQQQLTNSQQQSQKLPSPRENTPESGISSTEPQKVRTLTLLQWISAKENHNTLKVMAEECLQGLVTFDDDKFDKLKQEVLNIIRFAEQEEIKEIKGLEDRLCGLEKLMFQLKKLVQDQKELSTAFQQNQNRASNLGDASILPDLCASHRSQLLVMLSSHKAIRDIRRRISRAKDELGANLEKRLKYIVTIENTMSELDNNLLFYHRCLKRVERHLNIIQQIHQTPSIYVSAVTEVIRRRIFSGEFVQWASNLACDFYTIHNEEVMRRQEFNASFEGHFLNTLFPGINDIPPAFANETPIIFDSNLPNLTKNDIEILSSYLPELTSTIQLPDMGSVIEFFVSRSGNKSADDKSSLTGKSQSNTAVGSTGAVPHRPIDIHAHLKDGFESETDTEEFEKVGQSANERNIPLLTATIATSTSENIRQTNSAGTSTDPLETHTVETLTESCAPKKPPRTTKILNTTRHTEAPLPAIPEKPDNSIKTNSNTQKIAQPFCPDIPNSLTSPHSLLYKQKSNHQHQDYYYHNYYETVGHQPLSLSGEPTSIISISTTSRPGPNQSPTSPYPINNILIDNEFVNSEFYIDESLPSSLNDDEDNFKDSCIDERERVVRSYFHKTRDYGGQRSSSSDESIGAVQSIDKSNFNKRSLETVFGLLQENLGSTRLEVERLKSLLNNMSQISYQCLDTLKKHLKSIKSDAESAKQELQADITKITESWSEIKNNCEAREKETLKRLSTEHQRIIDDIQKDLNSKQFEINVLIDEKSSLTNAHSQAISNLKEERDSLNEKIQKLSQEIECLQHDIKRSDAEKDKAVIECRDRLIHEHKTEIESLRCRFKLMTSMERSPSDTSLEKIEKPDVIDIACHELILNQTREDLNIKKELAVIAAVEEERAKWISQNHPTSSDIELLKNIIEEKTKQLDAMRERDLVLYKENCQLKIKIESLTTEEESDKVWLKEKIDFLNKDKNRLEQELTMEKSRRMEMETSFAAIKGPTIRDQGSTPELSGGRCKMTSSQSLMKQGAIIESCVKGDIVFVVWNVKHGQYTVVQDSSSLYFVHGDSLPALNLRLPGNGETDIPVPFYCVGRIVDKEYCQARKDENRYKVTKGTRFYRVKLQPLAKSETSRTHHNKRERYESSSSSTSVSRSTSTQHLIDSFAQTENPVVHSSSRDMVDSASLKERTTSVTSVAEEDDEPISLLSERCRYISLSEEDEKANIDSSSSNTDCAITTNISTSTTSITTTTTTSSTNQQIPTESSSEKEQDDSDEYRSLEAKDETYFP